MAKRSVSCLQRTFRDNLEEDLEEGSSEVWFPVFAFLGMDGALMCDLTHEQASYLAVDTSTALASPSTMKWNTYRAILWRDGVFREWDLNEDLCQPLLCGIADR